MANWTYEEQQDFEAYEAFIAAIDNTQAGTDEYGNLAWHIDCSAKANGGTYRQALDTAVMILDCWKDFYPQLILGEPE